jgi:hypothetical protein
MAFRDNDIGVLRFFVIEMFRHLAKHLFFSCNKAGQTNCFSLRTAKLCQNQPKGKPNTQEKYHIITYMKVSMKVFTGLNLPGGTVYLHHDKGIFLGKIPNFLIVTKARIYES